MDAAGEEEVAGALKKKVAPRGRSLSRVRGQQTVKQTTDDSDWVGKEGVGLEIGLVRQA
jgi:hypothetical protein